VILSQIIRLKLSDDHGKKRIFAMIFLKYKLKGHLHKFSSLFSCALHYADALHGW